MNTERTKRRVATKSVDVCQDAADNCGMFRSAVSTAVTHFFAAMLDRLEAGEAVSVSGFGTFSLTRRKARVNNDVSGLSDYIYTPPIDTVRFKPCNKLKKRMWLRSTEGMPEVPEGARLGERIANVLRNS